MQYRREIDGLRAVAVVPVILFHAGFSLFSGGFVGVDVFFVISGYLITGILIGELERGDFSIARFYERRARRILPALFLVIACCIPFAWYLMLPQQQAEFAASIAAVTLFSSNVLFWMQTGYFASDAELRPLLHTWSLAVEEQYYLLFPILLAVFWRWGRQRVLLLIVLAALASLALSQWASDHAESANFYLAPPRAWELLAGSICAFLLRGRPSFANSWLSGLGLALIVFSILFLDDSLPFPGIYALPPVLGTVLIILFGGAGTPAARLLSLRAFVGIGLISYSAYLWHQPLFAFARLGSDTEPTRLLMTALAGLSLILAWLSWRFVEQPFRGKGALLPSRPRLFAVSGLAIAVMLAIGLAGYLAKPPTRIELEHPVLLANAEREARTGMGWHEGSMPCEGFVSSEGLNCRRYGDGPEKVVFWGDSHVLMLGPAVRPLPGKTIYVIGLWGCPPLLGVARQDRFGNFYFCDQPGTIDSYAKYVESLQPDEVFLVARWTLYARGHYVQSRLQRDTHFITDGRADFNGAESSAEVLREGMLRTIAHFSRSARVYVVQQIPDMHEYTPRARVLMPAVPRSGIEEWHASETSMLHQAAAAGATVIETHDAFCDAQSCTLRDGMTPIYFDDNHVGYLGSRRTFEKLVNAM
ncbi:MAG TPA: acyltransferase family protein [Croceibacterium sp.]|nr:acyltransferase family protein [Croceibacterium sp.]